MTLTTHQGNAARNKIVWVGPKHAPSRFYGVAAIRALELDQAFIFTGVTSFRIEAATRHSRLGNLSALPASTILRATNALLTFLGRSGASPYQNRSATVQV
jgi:hypothetical protein